MNYKINLQKGLEKQLAPIGNHFGKYLNSGIKLPHPSSQIIEFVIFCRIGRKDGSPSIALIRLTPTPWN
jgi:hypothetical protein